MGVGLGQALGDTIGSSTGPGAGFSLVAAMVCVIALGLYALSQGESGNDDDDSTPGGGLMQPVA